MTRAIGIFVGALVFLAPLHARAQQEAVVFGNVINEKGPIPGLTVSLAHPVLGRSKPAYTTDSGIYVIPNVPIRKDPYYLEIYWGSELLYRAKVAVASETVSLPTISLVRTARPSSDKNPSEAQRLEFSMAILELALKARRGFDGLRRDYERTQGRTKIYRVDDLEFGGFGKQPGLLYETVGEPVVLFYAFYIGSNQVEADRKYSRLLRAMSETQLSDWTYRGETNIPEGRDWGKVHMFTYSNRVAFLVSRNVTNSGSHIVSMRILESQFLK